MRWARIVFEATPASATALAVSNNPLKALWLLLRAIACSSKQVTRDTSSALPAVYAGNC
jgi:hypothetical protein